MLRFGEHRGKLAEPVAANRLLTAAGPAERARLAPYLDEVTIDRDAVLIDEDEPSRAVWFPQDALFSTIATTQEGHRIEVGLAGFDGAVGLDLLLGGVSYTTVVAQIAGTALRMDARHFARHVVEHGGPLHALLLRYTNAFIGCVTQIAACNAAHAVDLRLARWLAMARDRTGRSTLPLTHEAVAMVIGVRRASVTLVAGRLREARAIDYVRGEIRIVDSARLEREACDCYPVIRARAEAVFA